MNMVSRDPLDEFLLVLGELNLKADFTLSVDQKTKITDIRDALKKERDKYQTDHEADFKEIQTQITELRNTAGQNQNGQDLRERFQELNEARQQLVDDAPKSDDALLEIKGLLSTDQLKAFAARQVERKAEADKARKEMLDRMVRNGGPGQGGGQGGPNQGGGQGQGGGGGRRGGGNAGAGAGGGAPGQN
jgi:hypothetical protein